MFTDCGSASKDNKLTFQEDDRTVLDEKFPCGMITTNERDDRSSA